MFYYLMDEIKPNQTKPLYIYTSMLLFTLYISTSGGFVYIGDAYIFILGETLVFMEGGIFVGKSSNLLSTSAGS